MTWYLNLRTQGVGGGIAEPRVYEGEVASDRLSPVSDFEVARQVRGRDILLVAHGFNVNRTNGIQSLGHLDERLKAAPPAGNDLVLGILWPGDFWIPVVNYPAEAGDAVICGRHVAAFCDTALRNANSISFLSHSLGGRLVLEAVIRMHKRARTVCLIATAVDRDCLVGRYAGVAERCDGLSTLSSREDMVLKLAYPAGDLLSDLLFGDDDSPFKRALGLSGPKPVPATGRVMPTQIPDASGYGHGSYMPPYSNLRPPPGGDWQTAVEFMIRAYRGQPGTWP